MKYWSCARFKPYLHFYWNSFSWNYICMTWAGKAPVTHKAASSVAYVRGKTVVHMTSRTPYHRNELCWSLLVSKTIRWTFFLCKHLLLLQKMLVAAGTWAKILYVTSLRTAQESLQKEEGEEIIFRLPIPDWGPVYTYPYSFENVTFFLRFQKNSRPLIAFSSRFRPSTRMWWINLKTITYPTVQAWLIRVRLLWARKSCVFKWKRIRVDKAWVDVTPKALCIV